MLTVLVWWVWMQILGLAALPLAYRFFRRMPDRGYAFARPLGLLLTSYLLWLGSSLGLLRNSLGGALFSIGLVALISFAFYRRARSSGSADGPATGDPGLLAWLRAHGRLVLSVEILFAAALALWSFLRAFSPELTTAGGEKFMEIMYLNSIGRSEYFPPHDAWLSGYAISYYYFGYVMTALVTLLSGFAAHLTFNVGVANLFALTCTGAFGIVYNLVKGLGQWRAEAGGEPKDRTRPVAWGFLGALLVAVLGNLEGFLEVLYSARLLPMAFWQWLDIQDINQPYDLSVAPSLLPTRSGWWWWRASRVIHDLDPAGNSMGVQPIDEFPGFSFLLGDMHPHVLALPFVLLALIIALNALLAGRESVGASEPEGWLAPLKRLPLLVPLSLGALAFLNTWDFPIYWLVFLGSYGLSRWRGHGRFNGAFFRDVGVTGLAVAILGFIFYLPFYIGFQSQAGGLLPTLYVGTRFRQYFVMFGPFLVAIAGMLVTLAIRWRRETSGIRLIRDWLIWTALLVILPLAIMLLIVAALLVVPQGRALLDGIRQIPAVYEVVGDASWISIIGKLLGVKARTWVMPLIVAALSALGIVLLQRSLRSGPDSAPSGGDQEPPAPPGPGGFLQHPSIQFALICAILGLLLTLSVEFFYLVDVFRVRMNTIFKFYFQAWVLMAIASAFGVYWMSRGLASTPRATKGVRMAFLAAFWVLFIMGLFYPVLGNISRADQFSRPPNLDGTAYLAETHPDDYAAITWLNEQIPGAPVILEKPGTGGSSYVYEGRVSALTGLPTLLGWAGHENQWRGSYEIQSIREPDIETIYNSLDPETALTLLAKYDVTYVYVGPLERAEYNPQALEKFGRIMDVVYEQGNVIIYQVRE
jgi:YYY domain-containing protein